MNFKKDGNNIKLDSITDDGKALDITKYSEPLLSIGADGKYTRTSIELSDTKESSNNEVNSNTEPDNQVISATLNNSGELTTQEVESPNTEQNNPNDANTLDQACKDLELEPGCENKKTDPTYKTKYKVLALKYHPDKCLGNNLSKEECESKIRIINEAYDKLTDYTDENNEQLAIEDQPKSISSVFPFANKLPETNTNSLTTVRVPPENNRLQVATTQTGGKTKRRKAGKKNKSKRVRFMSRRNRRR
jgi:hypothetical protein